jgi:hypothetical protein
MNIVMTVTNIYGLRGDPTFVLTSWTLGMCRSIPTHIIMAAHGTGETVALYHFV